MSYVCSCLASLFLAAYLAQLLLISSLLFCISSSSSSHLFTGLTYSPVGKTKRSKFQKNVSSFCCCISGFDLFFRALDLQPDCQCTSSIKLTCQSDVILSNVSHMEKLHVFVEKLKTKRHSDCFQSCSEITHLSLSHIKFYTLHSMI